MSQVLNDEILARFIYSRTHFKPSDRTVKYAAFMPPKDKRLSVFRISGLNEDDVWEIGDNLRPGQLSKARANIGAGVVIENGLTINPDDIPPRHANIEGWPEDEAAIRLKAVELASNARLVLKNQV